MKTFFAVLAAACLFSTSHAYWSLIGNYDGKDWYVSEAADTYTNQRAMAADYGLVIASFHNEGDTDFIRRNVSYNEQLYIGFSDELSEGKFIWDDGSEVDYTYWNTGEPNNNGNENYTLMNWGPAGEWNDINVNYGARAIATSIPTPEPASMLALGFGALALLRKKRK